MENVVNNDSCQGSRKTTYLNKLLLCALIIIFGCNVARSQTTFKSEKITWLSELRLANNELISDADSFVLFSNPDYLIYLHQRYVDPETTELDLATLETKVTRAKDSILNQYFIYKRGEKMGFEYIPMDSLTITGQVPVEHFLTRNGFPAHAFKGPSRYKMISKDRQGPLNTEVYVDPDPGIQDPDTLQFTYDDRIRDMEFSLSPMFEKSGRSKLSKVTLIKEAKSPPGTNEYTPKLTRSFELRKVQVQDQNLQKVLQAYRDETGN